MFLRKSLANANQFLLSRSCRFCSKGSTIIINSDNEAGSDFILFTNPSLHQSPIVTDHKTYLGDYNIELVDHDSWKISSCLARAWRGSEVNNFARETRFSSQQEVHDSVNYESVRNTEGDPDLDDVDNMRIRGNLFYKLDRASKEYEEYSYDFHRKKQSSNKKEDPKERKKNDKLISNSEKLPKIAKNRYVIIEKDNASVDGKKQRVPTFNQLTDPYHKPFCLDIYISKASVRACIIHRVTSKVVAVAHSISKDMKFDLGSRRDSAACAAVGAVMAQRALADDIHDVVYIPRKGERIEGKLQIVLSSIIDNGINVNVKIKQRRVPKKAGHPYRV